MQLHYYTFRHKLLGQTLVLRPRQKTVLSLGHVNGKIKFTFTIGAGIPARPSRKYFAREPPCSKVFCTLTPVVTHYYGPDNPAHSSDTAPAWWAIPPSISRPPAPPAPPPQGTGCRWPHGQALVTGVTNICGANTAIITGRNYHVLIYISFIQY